MSRGGGRIEQAIAALVADSLDPSSTGYLRVRAWDILIRCYGPWSVAGRPSDWEPSDAQRKAVTRAMHSFVRRHNRYALAGGQGRRSLFLYEPGDMISAEWARRAASGAKFEALTTMAIKNDLHASGRLPAPEGPPLQRFDDVVYPLTYPPGYKPRPDEPTGIKGGLCWPPRCHR